MNVRRPALDRIDQDLVDVANDGRVVRVRAAYLAVGFALAALNDFQIFEINIANVQRLRLTLTGSLLDQLGELVLLHQDRLGHHASGELDLI